VASLSQGRTAAAQCGLFTHKSVPVIFEPPCSFVGKPVFPTYEGVPKNNENFFSRGEGRYFRLLPLGACTWLPSASVGQAASL